MRVFFQSKKKVRKGPNALPQRKIPFLILHTSSYIILKEVNHPEEGNACIQVLKIFMFSQAGDTFTSSRIYDTHPILLLAWLTQVQLFHNNFSLRGSALVIVTSLQGLTSLYEGYVQDSFVRFPQDSPYSKFIKKYFLNKTRTNTMHYPFCTASGNELLNYNFDKCFSATVLQSTFKLLMQEHIHLLLATV